MIFAKTLLGIAAVAVTALGADLPDFTGKWKINVSKSNFGPAPPASSDYVRVVKLEGSMVTITDENSPVGDNATRTYEIGGKEIEFESNGAVVKIKAVREGDAIVLHAMIAAGGLDIQYKITQTVSADGKSLTNVTRGSTPQGDFELKMVFDRQ